MPGAFRCEVWRLCFRIWHRVDSSNRGLRPSDIHPLTDLTFTQTLMLILTPALTFGMAPALKLPLALMPTLTLCCTSCPLCQFSASLGKRVLKFVLAIAFAMRVLFRCLFVYLFIICLLLLLCFRLRFWRLMYPDTCVYAYSMCTSVYPYAESGFRLPNLQLKMTLLTQSAWPFVRAFC